MLREGVQALPLTTGKNDGQGILNDRAGPRCHTLHIRPLLQFDRLWFSMSVRVLHSLITKNLLADLPSPAGRERREKIPKEFRYLRQFLPAYRWLRLILVESFSGLPSSNLAADR